jgi:hypothetical protein
MFANPMQAAYENMGCKIIVTQDQPKMVLSDDCPVTPEFRAEINLWMLGFFGMSNLIEDGQAKKVGNTLMMNPRTYLAFKESVKARLPKHY